MTRAIFLSLPLLLASQSVWAASSTAGGHSAVALAGVVASYSPTLPVNEKVVMAKLFDGQDPDARDAARTRWSEAKSAGFEVTYWRADDSGGWRNPARSSGPDRAA